MLQISQIRNQPENIIERLSIKNFDAREAVSLILVLDEKRREKQKRLEDNLSEANRIAKEIGALFKEGKREEAEGKKHRSGELKALNKDISDELDQISEELNNLILTLPNLPHESVPAGNSEADNETISQEGEIPDMDDDAVPHWELATQYNIIDFDLGAKVTGAGFPFYVGKGSRLQRALINFFLDKGLEAGYLEYQPPLLVNEDSGYGTGQLPDKDGQMYHATMDNLYLIPTAEVPLTNIFRDRILKPEEMPIKITAYSACFRREAGSYGKDVRGLNRLHQFDKVEIVQVQHPEKSYETLEIMREYIAGILRDLELPFRVLRLCGGDLSFTSALTYDFEVFSAAQKRWLEVSSVSNFEAFQSNRMKLRFKNEKGKTELAHTLNGSALALPRIVAALLENNQTEKGIRIPEKLRPYTGFDYIS